MSTNPKAHGPIPNYELSTLVRYLEDRFADLEHVQAKEWIELDRTRTSLAHWKDLYIAAQDEIAELKLKLAKKSRN